MVQEGVFFHIESVDTICFALNTEIEVLLGIFIFLGPSNTPKNGEKSGTSSTLCSSWTISAFRSERNVSNSYRRSMLNTGGVYGSSQKGK